jgi:hypothetical protein
MKSPLQSSATEPPKQTKPFSALWRAKIYFMIAFAFWVLHETIPAPFSSITSPQRQWWHDLTDKGFGSFDKISYFAFLAGLIYAVLSDALDYIWAGKLQTEIRKSADDANQILKEGLGNFTGRLESLTYEGVKLWIEGRRGTPSETRAIGLQSLKSYYEVPSNEAGNLVDFVVNELTEGYAPKLGQTWEELVSSVTIRPSAFAGCFEWEEERTYNLVCKGCSGKYTLQQAGSFRIDKANVQDALNFMQMKIVFGNATVVDLQKWIAERDKKDFTSTFSLEGEGVTLNYDGFWLSFAFDRECVIDSESTRVRMFEKSLISQDDRCYTFAVRHPTRGLRARLSLEGIPWIVKQPVTTAHFHTRHDKKRIIHLDKEHERSAGVHVHGWTPPGIAFVAEWTPSA